MTTCLDFAMHDDVYCDVIIHVATILRECGDDYGRLAEARRGRGPRIELEAEAQSEVLYRMARKFEGVVRRRRQDVS